MSLRDSILNNFWLKVFSLLLATLIWFAVHSNLQLEARFPLGPLHPPQTRDFQLPVSFLASPSQTHAYRLVPPQVTVKLHGDETTLKRITAHDIQAYVRLTSAPVSKGWFLVEVNGPRGIEIQQVLPTRVYLEPVGPPDK